MHSLHSDAVDQLLDRIGPPADDVLAAMEERADRDSFPTVGPAVGRTLALCTRLLGAECVFELGSGFGYSAYWIARALPTGGTIVLTERDPGLLDDARSYFERGGLDDRAVFEHGDAIDIAAKSDGPIDLVVLDHDTREYVRGFEAVRDAVAPGGAIAADNVVTTQKTDDTLTVEGLLATLDGEPALNDRTRAVAAFYQHVRADPRFEPSLIPVGEGLLVACRV